MSYTHILSRWRRRPLRATVEPALLPWLADPASLTARIRARCDDFSVAVLGQRLGPGYRDEGVVLGLREGEHAWVREVLLFADGVPVVFARSVVAQRSIRPAWRLFRGIGARPLGEALFADPRVVRGPLMVSSLDARDPRYHGAVSGARLVAPPPRLWARRSVFRLRGKALLVTEVFLPTIIDLPS